MAQVRLMMTGLVRDYESAVNVFRDVSNIAATVEGAQVWEAFVDADTGLYVLIEEYVSEEAFLRYEEEVTSAGLRMRETLATRSLVFLSSTENKTFKRRIDTWEGITVTTVASI